MWVNSRLLSTGGLRWHPMPPIRRCAPWPSSASRAAVYIVERQQEAPRFLELAQSQLADDPVLAVEIESHRANLLQVVMRQAEEGRRAAFRAAERARQLWGQPPVELTARERDAYVAALQVAFNAAVVEEDGAEQVRIADELGRVARGSEEGAVWADHDRAAALMFAGRVGEALDSGRRAWKRARERMLPMLVLTSGTNLLSKLLEASRLDEADEVITECLDQSPTLLMAKRSLSPARRRSSSRHS